MRLPPVTTGSARKTPGAPPICCDGASNWSVRCNGSRALAKADAEMGPGSWVVSLEFEAAGRPAHARMEMPSGRPVWVYRIGG